jgi:hypothetical protein
MRLLKLLKPKSFYLSRMNQSFSFRMLNKWIEDSSAVTWKSKKDEEEAPQVVKSEGKFGKLIL